MVRLTLINDDCLRAMPSLPAESIDLLVTDPPYNISGLSENIELHGKPVNLSDFGEWDYQYDPKPFLSEIKRLLKPNGQAYIFCADRQIGTYISLFQEYGFCYKNLLVVHKENLMPKVRHFSWRAGCEYIVYALKQDLKSDEYTFNWQGQHEMDTLLRTNIVGGKNRLNTDKRYDHPAQKALEIVKRLIKVSSNEGCTVLDPYLGSGTTMQACLELGRNCVGIERDSKYIEVTKDRLNWGSTLGIGVEFVTRGVD